MGWDDRWHVWEAGFDAAAERKHVCKMWQADIKGLKVPVMTGYESGNSCVRCKNYQFICVKYTLQFSCIAARLFKRKMTSCPQLICHRGSSVGSTDDCWLASWLTLNFTERGQRGHGKLAFSFLHVQVLWNQLVNFAKCHLRCYSKENEWEWDFWVSFPTRQRLMHWGSRSGWMPSQCVSWEWETKINFSCK